MYKHLLFLLLAAPLTTFSQNGAATPNPLPAADTIRLMNRTVKRDFLVSDGHFRTVNQQSLRTGTSFQAKGAFSEFAFRIDGAPVGTTSFLYRSSAISHPGDKVQLLTVMLDGMEATPAAGLSVVLKYWLYDTLPVVRKQVVITSHLSGTVDITDLDMENIALNVSWVSASEIYSNFGTSLVRMPYKGDYNDAALLIWNAGTKEGVITGNEAISVMKRTEVYTHGYPTLQIGLAASGDTYPFSKSLNPGETFNSPRSFLCYTQAKSWEDAFEGDFQAFTRQWLDIRFYRHKDPPLLMYNTWRPFRNRINERLIISLADALKGSGTDLFIMDDGWFDMTGNWNVDTARFPHGLAPVFQHIRDAGMKTGLWFSFATVSEHSDVARQHPEWLLHDSAGRPTQIHSVDPFLAGSNAYTISMASPWYDMIKEKISRYVRTCKLDYVKLDLGVIIGSYQPNPANSGDYIFPSSTPNGKSYRDRAGSYYAIFEKTQQLCDDLHAEFPDLLIDYTYETHGRQNGVDYGLLQHAEYDWTTNYELPAPEGPLSIRQMRFQRARTTPVSTLLIGNQNMGDSLLRVRELTYFSLAASAGILVGDARKLSPDMKEWYRRWNEWFHHMNKDYQFTQWYRSGEIFDAPTSENWDGCYRFNEKKEGGVLFFFRNNSSDNARTFKVPGVNPASSYKVYDPMSPASQQIITGKVLLDKGLTVSLREPWSAKTLGIEKIK
jgi:alpha-galactosidase